MKRLLLLLAALIWSINAAQAVQYDLYKRKVEDTIAPFTANPTIQQLLFSGRKEYATAYGIAEADAPLPLQIRVGIGYPINANGKSSISVKTSLDLNPIT